MTEDRQPTDLASSPFETSDEALEAAAEMRSAAHSTSTFPYC